MSVATRSSRSRINPCNICHKVPVWIRTGASRFSEGYKAKCDCGEMDFGRGPKWMGIEDWNLKNPSR